MAISVRTRFEVFKRDEFTCKYCGRRSPDAVLEIDHVIPVAGGGSDDPMNLVTSCWECNSGKSCVPLNTVMTGEDPHDRAVLILERERQLAEYNRVLELERARAETDAWGLWRYWQEERGFDSHEDTHNAPRTEIRWLLFAVRQCPYEVIRDFMDLALAKGMTKSMRYVNACVRNWIYARQANRDMNATEGNG